jgi:hypothetical protein
MFILKAPNMEFDHEPPFRNRQESEFGAGSRFPFRVFLAADRLRCAVRLLPVRANRIHLLSTEAFARVDLRLVQLPRFNRFNRSGLGSQPSGCESRRDDAQLTSRLVQIPGN